MEMGIDLLIDLFEELNLDTTDIGMGSVCFVTEFP